MGLSVGAGDSVGRLMAVGGTVGPAVGLAVAVAATVVGGPAEAVGAAVDRAARTLIRRSWLDSLPSRRMAVSLYVVFCWGQTFSEP